MGRQFDEEIEILPEWIDQGYALVMFTANSPDSGINKAGSFIQIERLNEVYEGNMYDLRANLPEVTVLELLKTLTLMFNLHFETDTERRIVRMEPRDNFYTTDGPDISPIVDRSAPLEQELLSASYPRTQRWAYANDRDDTLLDEHKQRTQRAFAAASLGNPNQTVTDTNDTEARPFSATYAQLETDSGLSVPQFIATPDEPEFRTDFAPRILYVRPRQIEEMRIENRLQDTICPSASYSAGVHTFERYQQAYFSGDRLSLRFDDEPGQNRGLLARYYAAEWANLAQARLVKLRARPGVPALRDLLQFRALQSFDGQRYALQRIGRVKPGAAEPFEVTLQRMDVRTRRVDFPFAQQYCLQLNGGNERVQVTDADTLLTAQYFTCSLWFRRLSGFGSLQVLASQTLASGAGFFMALNGTDHLRIGYSDGVNERGFTSVNSITDTDWHYLSFIRRSASPLDWDVLLDGENLAMSTFGAANEQSLVSLQTPIDIGGDGTNGFIGQIALVHVQHHLISQSEHSHRFNDGQGAMPHDYRRTQLLLPLNQPTGAVCPDEALPPKEATLLNKPAAGTDFGTDTWLPWRES
ncbi:MAG: LamG-like jellyroll fold domain-containing protein [Bacteroidota bacterium]